MATFEVKIPDWWYDEDSLIEVDADNDDEAAINAVEKVIDNMTDQSLAMGEGHLDVYVRIEGESEWMGLRIKCEPQPHFYVEMELTNE